MSNKRIVPSPLKHLLDVDIKITNNIVKFIDQNFGPLVKYRHIFKYLEISCHGIPWLVGTCCFIFLTSFISLRQLGVNIFLALLLDLAVVAVVKASTRRRRPPGNVNDMFATYAMDKFSFPSGHATRAVMLGTVLPLKVYLIFPLPLLMLVWCGSVCASRVLMRRHYILDVAGGMVIGWLEAFFVAKFIWLSEESAAALLSMIVE